MTDSETCVSADSEQSTVFVVDDEEDMILLYEGFLGGEYNVQTATSGPEALQKIDSSVDVVLLDRTMSEMSGDEVLGIIREEGLEVQVAMVTSVKPTEEVVDMPFDGYMTKPVTGNEVLGLVDTLMTRKEYHRASQEFFRCLSKIAALEEGSCESSEDYEKLVGQSVELRTQINGILDDVTPEKSASRCR